MSEAVFRACTHLAAKRRLKELEADVTVSGVAGGREVGAMVSARSGIRTFGMFSSGDRYRHLCPSRSPE